MSNYENLEINDDDTLDENRHAAAQKIVHEARAVEGLLHDCEVEVGEEEGVERRG